MTQKGPREIIALLNALSLGELTSVERELSRAREALLDLGQAELGERVEEARRELQAGRLKEFRRAVATVTARLGHVAKTV